MGGLNPFKSQKPDTAAIERQERLAREQEEKLKREEDERKRMEAERTKAQRTARRGGSAGGRSLLSGLETGVSDKRGSLG